MDILGIGPLEIFFILILVVIVFGPKDLSKAGKTIGRFLHQVTHSDTWKSINQATHEIRNLPNRLMKEASLEEFKQMNRDILSKENWIDKPGINSSGDEKSTQLPTGNLPKNLESDENTSRLARSKDQENGRDSHNHG
jgi:Sec-independent protein translocase protein TatA